jgi:acylphosphatase
MERRLIYASGQVQGVGFRASAQKIANQLGLGGYVENLSDGRVKIEVQGESSALDIFCRHIEKIPPRGDAKLEVVLYECLEGGDGFHIR